VKAGLLKSRQNENRKARIIFLLMLFILIFPALTWSEDNDYLKYLPQVIATGNQTIDDKYGDLVRYRYNPIEGGWKIRTNKCTLKYNPMEDEWTYVYPGEVLRFNPAENSWDYQFIEKRLRYDIIAERWFYGYSLIKPQTETKGTLTSTSPLP
jgi:hypothetical protein